MSTGYRDQAQVGGSPYGRLRVATQPAVVPAESASRPPASDTRQVPEAERRYPTPRKLVRR
jgi:hypothetical protein